MRISDWSSDVCSSDLICHTLGGTFDLPHADVHAIVLPYVAEFNASAAPGAMARVAMALGGLAASDAGRSEEHTSELQSLMRNSYAVFCLIKKKVTQHTTPVT